MAPRDFVAEAVSIARGDDSITPRAEHVRALYRLWQLKTQALDEVLHSAQARGGVEPDEEAA